MQQFKVLAIDDRPEEVDAVKSFLESRGMPVQVVTSADEALSLLRYQASEIFAVLLDFNLPDQKGDEMIGEIYKLNPDTSVVMLSGDSTQRTAVDSLKAGAIDFFLKGNDPDQLYELLNDLQKRYIEKTQTIDHSIRQSQNRKLINSIGLDGCSESMAEVVRMICLYKTNPGNVLLLGDTGTGKEECAKALHSGPENKFAAVNCATFSGSSNLLESELFGYERGAFTGADREKKGIFEELSGGGTIFLDEIQELPTEAQKKLLRVVQHKTLRRIGGKHEFSVNVRIIAAGKDDLPKLVELGKFHRDLFERFVFTIRIPSLKERPEDIPYLVSHFTKKYSSATQAPVSFLKSCVDEMMKYEWPGNVRQLENAVNRIMLHVSSENRARVESADFYKDLERQQRSVFRSKRDFPPLSEVERRQDLEIRELFSKALRQTGGNQRAAARLLQTPHGTFYDRLKKFGLAKIIERSEAKQMSGGRQ